MTFDEKKEILLMYRKADREWKCYNQMIEEYQQSYAQAKSQRINGMPYSSNGISDLSDYFAKMEVMNTNLLEKMLNALNVRNEILNWIATLTDSRQRAVLIYRYVQCRPIGWIAETMDPVPLSEKTVKRLTNKAINNLPENFIKCP